MMNVMDKARVAAFVDDWAAREGLELLAFGVGVDCYFDPDEPATAKGRPMLRISLLGPDFPAPATVRVSVRPELFAQAANAGAVVVSQLRAVLAALRT
jgi:hypothetical protein